MMGSPIGVAGGEYVSARGESLWVVEESARAGGLSDTGDMTGWEGALRIRNRCLMEVLRETDVDEGVGGIGYVGGGSGETVGSGDAVIGYRSEDWVWPLLPVEIRWYSGSSGLGGKTVVGGGFGAFKDNLNARCATESRREALGAGTDLGSFAKSSWSGAGGGAKLGIGRGGGTDTR